MFHTFDERSRPARRPAGSPGRRPLQGRRAHGRMSSHPLSTHYCAALDAHVAAVVRSLRCCLVSSGRISARAPRVAPLSKSHGHFSARAAIRSRARRASFIFPGTDRVCAVSFSVHYRSPLSPQFSFLCKHMCTSRSPAGIFGQHPDVGSRLSSMYTSCNGHPDGGCLDAAHSLVQSCHFSPQFARAARIRPPHYTDALEHTASHCLRLWSTKHIPLRFARQNLLAKFKFPTQSHSLKPLRHVCIPHLRAQLPERVYRQSR